MISIFDCFENFHGRGQAERGREGAILQGTDRKHGISVRWNLWVRTEPIILAQPFPYSCGEASPDLYSTLTEFQKVKSEIETMSLSWI